MTNFAPLMQGVNHPTSIGEISCRADEHVAEPGCEEKLCYSKG